MLFHDFRFEIFALILHNFHFNFSLLSWVENSFIENSPKHKFTSKKQLQMTANNGSSLNSVVQHAG